MNEASSWRRHPYLVFSAVFSIVGVLFVGLCPALWPFGLSSLVVVHAVVIGSGFFPRSKLLGSNISRLPDAAEPDNRVALTFDDGPDPEVTPLILTMLAKHNAKATFFCVGKRANAHPEVVRDIVKAGHAVGNHSLTHTHFFWFLGPKRLARELATTQLLLQRLSGRKPAYFRAPAGIRSPWLDPVLVRNELALVSWSRRGFDTVDRDPHRILNRLTTRLTSGEVLLLHDRPGARTKTGGLVVLEVLPRLLNELRLRGFETTLLP